MASTPEKYMIKLMSSDDVRFDIGREAIKLSNTIKNFLQDCGRDDASDEEKQNSSPIPLPNVTTILKKSLLDLTCKTVANMIKGKSPEEIRRTFNIKNDFTVAEEEKMRKENAWCDDSSKNLP